MRSRDFEKGGIGKALVMTKSGPDTKDRGVPGENGAASSRRGMEEGRDENLDKVQPPDTRFE